MKKIKVILQGGSSLNFTLADEEYTGKAGTFYDLFAHRHLRRNIASVSYKDTVDNKAVIFHINDIVGLEVQDIPDKKPEPKVEPKKEEQKSEQKSEAKPKKASKTDE